MKSTEDMSPEAPAEPNTVQLRDKMQSARTLSQTSARDPAAAPFDTDDEAAGRPASREAVQTAMANEARVPSEATTEKQKSGMPGNLWVAAAVLLALVFLWAILT